MVPLDDQEDEEKSYYLDEKGGDGVVGGKRAWFMYDLLFTDPSSPRCPSPTHLYMPPEKLDKNVQYDWF